MYNDQDGGCDGSGHFLVILSKPLNVNVEHNCSQGRQRKRQMNLSRATRVPDRFPVSVDEIKGVDGGEGEQGAEVGEKDD